MACSLTVLCGGRQRLSHGPVLTFLDDPRLIRAAKVLFWLALIFAVVMAVLPRPPQTPIDEFGDKFAHMLAFATLGGLAAIAWGWERSLRIFAWLAVLGAGIELVQMIPALHRDADWRDWVADCAAVLVALAIGRIVVPPRGA